MEKSPIVAIGGSVERAIKGEYALNLQAIFKEAWQLTLKGRASINLGLIFVFCLGTIATLILGKYFGGLEQATQNEESFMVIQLVITIIIWPFMAGVEMMGVLHSVGLSTKAKHVFSFLKRSSAVVLCTLFTSVLVGLGFQLILPGVFLAVCFSLTIPLVVEKNLSPLKACIVSIQAIRFQFFKVLALYGILTGLLALALVPMILLQSAQPLALLGLVIFLVLLSYLAPLFFNIKGILYREIFGLQGQIAANVSNDSSSFSA